MASKNFALTAEYDYVSPSMYAYARHMNEAPEIIEPRREKAGHLKQVQKVNNKPKHAAEASISLSRVLQMVTVMALIGALMIGLVWTSARTSSINYSINQLKSQNAVLENDIKMLTIEIESSNSIQQVEKYATKNLKLVYPTQSQCVYVENIDSSTQGLAASIKEKAYTQSKETK